MKSWYGTDSKGFNQGFNLEKQFNRIKDAFDN